MDFNQLFLSLKEGVIDDTVTSLKDYKEEFKEDTMKFLNSTKSKLEKWTFMLKDGDIDIDEYEFLVKAQKDLFEMKFLKQKGLSKIKIDKLKSDVLNKTILVVVTNLPSLTK